MYKTIYKNSVYEHESKDEKYNFDLLNTDTIGKRIIRYKIVDSTNTVAKLLLLSEEKEGTVIISDAQDKGRGRLNRTWISKENTGIWMSIILKPDDLPTAAYKYNFMTAVVVCDSINELTGKNTKIKWPNDILFNGKKICGILCELVSLKNGEYALIIGLGINSKLDTMDIPKGLKDKITCIYDLDSQVSNNILLIKVLENFDKAYLAYKKGQYDIFQLWKENNCTINNNVRVNLGNGQIIEGLVKDVNEYGQLSIMLDNGNIEVITTGDVNLIG
ncbi:MAG: biotin--[acetyl-CoA-carboxylase] ligase [Eubacteriaceae bacterium]